MTLVALPGDGLWVPPLPFGELSGTQLRTSSEVLQLDATLEEAQIIGTVHINGGGSKTFGTSGSSIGWLPGASQAFVSDAVLRIGVKDASKIDTANGPVARATPGTAAFNVYKDLVGGTDAITSTTWRTDAMAAGTPFTIAEGDELAICFQLAFLTGTQLIRVRSASTAVAIYPSANLITAAGTVFTSQAVVANLILTFNDGSLGWMTPSSVFSADDAASATIGNTNILGNVLRFPYGCQINALAAIVSPSTNAANFALDVYSTPLGTPSQIATLAFDANVQSTVGTLRLRRKQLATPLTLTANTDYCIGVRQTTATDVTTQQSRVSATSHWTPNGFDATCYAADSVAGATFAQQDSGTRRYLIWAHMSAIDIPARGGPFSRHQTGM